MKKFICFFAVTFLALSSYAQGSIWYIGGVAGYGSSTYKPTNGNEQKTNSWAFGPEFGTMLKKDLQLGFILGLNGSTEKYGDNDETTTTYFSPTIYVRKFKAVTDNFSVFSGLYFNYSTGKEDDNGDETTLNGFAVNLGFGVAYNITPRFTAVGQYGVLGYSSTTYKNDGEEYATQNDFGLGVNTVGSGSFVQGNGSGAVFNIGLYYTLSTGAK